MFIFHKYNKTLTTKDIFIVVEYKRMTGFSKKCLISCIILFYKYQLPTYSPIVWINLKKIKTTYVESTYFAGKRKRYKGLLFY